MPKTDSFLQVLGRRISLLRHAADLSQAELAEQANLSIEMVGKVERGSVNPSILVLRSVADALNTSLPRLVVEPGQLDLEVAAILGKRSKAEQARALMLLQALFAPIPDGAVAISDGDKIFRKPLMRRER